MKTRLSKPRTHLAEVLKLLIKSKHPLSHNEINKITRIVGISQRISNLRLNHELDIKCDRIPFINKHGKRKRMGTFSLEDKAKGIEVYNKINKTK
jgi:hypothetical protein